jgi:hypothetical protein
MRAPLARLNARIAGGRTRLQDAEDEIKRISERRLAELMKRSQRERFEQLDDPNLTNSDRLKLRRTIAASLRHGKMEMLAFRGYFRWRRVLHWIRYGGLTTAVAAAIFIPICILMVIARSNTGQVLIVPNDVTLDWTLPSGAGEKASLHVGDRLVVISSSGRSHVVRRWIKNQGYATSQLDSD